MMIQKLESKAPSLELLQIASPCTADWNEMKGDAQARHCAQCQLSVYNLSEMTRDEALAFLAEREGRTCIRMYKRSDGTVITRDCPVGLAAIRAKFVGLAIATFGLLIAITVGTLTALGKIPGVGSWLAEGKVSRLRQMAAPPTAWMGDVCLPTPPVVLLNPNSLPAGTELGGEFQDTK